MPLPKVKSDLIRSLGEQMQDNMGYVARIDQELWDENPELARVCYESIGVLNHIFAQYGNENDDATILLLQAAHTVARTTYLLMYQALKQQDICNELND